MTRALLLATCEALGAVDASMLAIVAPKHLLSLSDVFARPLALARAPGPASILREVCCRNPAPPRSLPQARTGCLLASAGWLLTASAVPRDRVN
jgi:hypothetical protein